MSSKNVTLMMRQYNEIKQSRPDCILFFRLGNFYEMFGDDAIIASKTLNIALTSRSKGEDAIPMCGVPCHALNNYLPRMVKAGYKVAICEQVEDPKLSKGLVKRDILKIVTPGANLEESLLEHKSNNFICAVSITKDVIGLALADLSTGLFRTTEFPKEDSCKLIDELERSNPKQVLVPSNIEDEKDLFHLLKRYSSSAIEKIESWHFSLENATAKILNQFKIFSLSSFGLDSLNSATRASGGLIHYLLDTQKGALSQINKITVINSREYIWLDSTTVHNLELVDNSFSHNQGSKTLFDILDHTSTAMGGRLLRDSILRPLADLSAIQSRLDSVTIFYENFSQSEIVAEILGNIADLERVVVRVAQFNASPADMLTLGESLGYLPSLKVALSKFSGESFSKWQSNWEDFSSLTRLIKSAISDTPPVRVADGQAIKDNFNEELDRLRSLARDSRKAIIELESKVKEETNLSSLKVRYNRAYGYFFEVSKRQSSSVPSDWMLNQSLLHTVRFVSVDLKKLESQILTAEGESIELEITLFEQIRAKAVAELEKIQFMASLIATVDLHLGFAILAKKRNYCRAEVNDSSIVKIVDGRHPLIENLLLEEQFTPNDTMLGSFDRELSIITGPNMSGKSTYIRQVALIVLMTHIGSYIPAKEATIGIVDRIFTRVGAHDMLQKGQSTFMVEMSEMANILNNMTSKCLLILDEVGRGTSTFDGL
ncbi:MAG: DNA mismatch repair protein MutS, partial [Nitrospinota bacterium]